MPVTAQMLRNIMTEARPALESYIASTRAVNLLFMDAWRGGYLDELWAGFREEFPDQYLTYFIRARGMGDIKIGKSNQVRARVKNLWTGASRGLDLLACYPATVDHESELKDEFAHLRLCGEWFRPGPDLLTHLSLVGCDVDAFTNAVPASFHRRHPERLS